MSTLFATAQKPITLRRYQRDAIDAAYAWFGSHATGHPLIVIPTGGGKTPVIATICNDVVEKWSGRVVVLAHVKELLEQAEEKLEAIAPQLDVGVYSAGLGRRETGRAVTLAGVQSIHRDPSVLGPVNLVLVDEAHLIPPSEGGMYRSVLEGIHELNPTAVVIGLTATPYRMTSGALAGPDELFTEVCYDIGVSELVAEGYLTKLRARAGARKADTSGIKMRGGEFVKSDAENAMMANGLVGAAVAEMLELTRDRKSVLVFTAGIEHGRQIVQRIEGAGQDCGWVDGSTLGFERAETLRRFRDGELKYLVNVEVLTTGFDAPGIDCVVLLRPTGSPGLYYQMVGRGFRIAEGKEDCLVLDYAGNVVRHGPVDAIQLRHEQPGGGSSSSGDAPAKECSSCHELVHASYLVCPACGAKFESEDREPKHEHTASAHGVLAGQVTIETYEISDIQYHTHTKRNAPEGAPRTMRVEYFKGYKRVFNEYICVEHPEGNYGRLRAKQWWKRRSRDEFPGDADLAVAIARNGGVAFAESITIEHTAGKQFPRLLSAEFGPLPELISEEAQSALEDKPGTVCGIPEEEIPF